MRPLAISPNFLSLLTASLALLLLGTLLLAPLPFVHTVFSGDDAGYYLEVARHSCQGMGWTADRIHPTNGFNPLFSVLLSASYSILLPDCGLEAGYRLAVSLGGIAVIASIFLVHQCMGRILAESRLSQQHQRQLVSCSVLFYASFICFKRIYGLDAPFILLFGTAYSLDVLRHGALEHRWRDIIVQGLLLGGLVLSRLDSLALVFAFLATQVLLSFPDKKKLLGILARGGIAGATLVPWATWSIESFGSWMPISARIKTSFPEIDVSTSVHTFLHTSISGLDQVTVVAVMVMALCVCTAAIRQVKNGGRKDIAVNRVHALLLMFSAYVVVRIVFMFLFSRMDIQVGYFVLVYSYLLYLLAWGFGWAHERRWHQALSWGVPSILVSTFLVLLLKFLVTSPRLSRMTEDGFTNQVELGERIGKLVGDDGVLFGGAFGIMGYFSDRPWVNKDGIINNFVYQKAIRDGQLQQYLEDSKVNYVVMFHEQAIPESGALKLPVRSHLYDATEILDIPVENIVLTTRLGERAPDKQVVVATYP